jgi:transposase-like protein
MGRRSRQCARLDSQDHERGVQPPGRNRQWHVDEVLVKINGTTPYRRAVDQHGTVLDILVQSRRTAVAAKRFFAQAARGPAIRAAGEGHRQAGHLSGRSPRACRR